MNEGEMYEKVCKPSFEYQNKRFDQQDAKLDRVIEILKGNGKPGIISRIDDLERSRNLTKGTLGLIIKNWQIIVVLAILAFNVIGGKSTSQKEIDSIIEKVKTIEKLVIMPTIDQGT